MSILLTAASSLLAALAVEPGVRTTEVNQRKVAQIRASILSGEWGWIKDLSYPEKLDVTVRIERWCQGSRTMDEAEARLRVLYEINPPLATAIITPCLWFRRGQRVEAPEAAETWFKTWDHDELTGSMLGSHNLWAMDLENQQALWAPYFRGIERVDLFQYLSAFIRTGLDACIFESVTIALNQCPRDKDAELRAKIRGIAIHHVDLARDHLFERRYEDASREMTQLSRFCQDDLHLGWGKYYQIWCTAQKLECLAYLSQQMR